MTIERDLATVAAYPEALRAHVFAIHGWGTAVDLQVTATDDDGAPPGLRLKAEQFVEMGVSLAMLFVATADIDLDALQPAEGMVSIPHRGRVS